jgi:hypothetical protein
MCTSSKSLLDLIKYPILTEKTSRLIEQNQYSFAVDRKAVFPSQGIQYRYKDVLPGLATVNLI